MRNSFFMEMLLLVLILGCTKATEDEVVYEGLRLDMSALTLNRDILATIVPALNRTLKAQFHDLKESGSFWTTLHLTHIRITYYKINEERFNLTGFEYDAPVYKLKGAFESIYFHIAFHYTKTWLGIKVSSGHGSAAVTNVNSEILVLFNETDPDVVIPHPWDIKDLTLSSSLGAPTSWAKSMLHKHFIPVFHKAVDDAMFDFAHNLLRTYRYIEDIFPHDIDLVFRNDIISVKPTVNGSYLSIAFNTNITVNQYIVKKMYRQMKTDVVPQGDFDYCLAAQLVPDVLDALGKGGYYDTEVPPELWGFETEKIREFFNIMPTLKERYTGEETFAIHCQSSRFETTNDITQRGSQSPVLQMQNPTYCFVYVPATGEYFMMVDMFMRFYYEMKCTNESFYGHILFASLYGFKTLPDLPESKRLILDEHLQKFTSFFTDSELISPGIKVIPNRHNELKYDWAYIRPEEICFYYKENKPYTPNNN
eukprot:TRINITY_DN1590_c1_g1_i1.p2 TRINITY_DN1590_c1_g1~~TRINITY_DN1590_c1_g1_i1.p2  ORF type:complete len:480 (+),score=39.45 TRINITY_DN1590_c1_g1_i1:3443-4882(+)